MVPLPVQRPRRAQPSCGGLALLSYATSSPLCDHPASRLCGCSSSQPCGPSSWPRASRSFARQPSSSSSSPPAGSSSRPFGRRASQPYGRSCVRPSVPTNACARRSSPRSGPASSPSSPASSRVCVHRTSSPSWPGCSDALPFAFLSYAVANNSCCLPAPPSCHAGTLCLAAFVPRCRRILSTTRMRVSMRQQVTAIRQFEHNRKRAHFKTQEFYHARLREYRRVVHEALRFAAPTRCVPQRHDCRK